MTSIDPASQLAAIIRQQLVETRNEISLRSRTSNENAHATVFKKANQNITELIARRVRAIDPDDPDRSRKAFKIFLESVLLNELGTDLINDPAFYRLVDEVQHTMESDASLLIHINQAGELLLASGASR